MTWTPRSDWINVKTDSRIPHAVGDGVTDDTAAIQAALDLMNNDAYNTLKKTVYFPAGTYKITNTLKVTNVMGYNLIGCGLNTVIKWYGPSGGAMFWADNAIFSRSVGFVWDGGGTGGLSGTGGAGCAYEEFSYFDNGSGTMIQGYMTALRHENESFRNFTQPGTYLSDKNFPSGLPPAAIISGFNWYGTAQVAMPVGEMTIFNCRFTNCTTGVYNALDIYNNFMWVIDGCQFDNNGTGFDGGNGGCYVLLNSHFEHNTLDVAGGYGIRCQRLTSTNSGQFFLGPCSNDSFQDCWVDSWTNTAGALELLYGGQTTIVDCTFSNPPSGALGAIFTLSNTGNNLNQLILSNNIAAGFPSGRGMLHVYGAEPLVDWVPAGSMSSNLVSPTQTFLKSTYPADSTHIIDVTQAPYNAVRNNFAVDATSAIQAAITAAQTANNGSIVYIPGGLYSISSTLTASGGNYIIEGEGRSSQLCWTGASTNTIMAVTSPQNVTVRNIHLSAPYNQPSTPGSYHSNWPTCDPTTINALRETASGTSNIVYDNVICDAFTYGNPGASGGNNDGPGLVLSGLPAGSTVNIPVLSSPLTVQDSGQAKIFSTMAYIGSVKVSGATNPKTGYTGLMVAEGGQQTAGLYNFTLDDNQSLLVGPYYSEQCANDVNLLRGSGTTPGRMAIEVMVSSPTPTSTTININNYAGRLYYGEGAVSGGGSLPQVQITQTGTNPVNLTVATTTFSGTNLPNYSLGAGANLISTLNWYGVPGNPTYTVPESPNPLPGYDLYAMAQSLDDFRQLGALNMAVSYGTLNPSGLVGYWKLDEASGPSPDSSMSGLTGTWKNSPTFSATHPSWIPYADAGCMTFNGTNQYIDTGSSTALPSGTHARTICGWGKSNSTAGGYRWIAAYGTPSTSQAMFIGMNGTTLVAGGYGNDLSVANFWDTNWHFIALTYDGTTAKLYADGKLLTSAAKSWNLVLNKCYIGLQVNGGEYWNGQIDDVRIYDYALAADEVSALGSGLVARWALDESSGPFSFDAAPNNVITGKWQNSPTFSTSHPSAITYTDAGSLAFNGTNQFVSMNPALLPTGTAARTICGWAKSNSTAAGGRWIAAFGSPNTSQAMFIGMNGTTLYGGGYADDLSVPSFWDTNWHFIALTYDGTTAKLYADGTLRASAAKTWNLVPYECLIGEQVNNSEYWNGNVDDVRIYSRALSATEIASLAAGNLNP